MPEVDAVPLYTAEQVRDMDRTAIEREGIAGYTLMSRAAAALLKAIDFAWPRARRICILCGPGNNGGDGYVLARLLAGTGREITLLALCDPAALGGDARRAADDYAAAGGVIGDFDGVLPETAEVLVDALLGTGLARPVDGDYRRAIEALNAHPAPVLAVDIPSGVHADSGAELGVAVAAHTTVTFIGRKRGLYTAAGVRCCGAVVFNDLGVPATVTDRPAATHLVDSPDLGDLSRPRRRDAHKGDFGHVLVVGGAPGMSGAARLAAEAAARCGAGLVSVATHEQHAACLNSGRPELMVHAVTTAAQLAPLLQRATVVAIGPGLDRGDWGRELLEQVLQSPLPLVVDADALNLLAADPVARDNWVLTPHPGEAARLLGCQRRAIQEDRFSAAMDLQARFGGVVVLKGAGSLVARADGAMALCAAGNPGMASGGMGDVLSGVIAALMAQGLAAGEAATTAVWLHADAADRAAGQSGERGLLAGDLIPLLRQRLNNADG